MKVATSILSVDFNNLEKEIKQLNDSDYLHLDVMDGEFVPNISFGYPVLKNISKIIWINNTDFINVFLNW